MGGDRIRHLLIKPLSSGATGHFWNPSQTLRMLGLSAEPLGTDYDRAKARAIELNAMADEIRRGSRAGETNIRPDSFSSLLKVYLASDEFSVLKTRTQKDYRYYLGKIELEFGHISVHALTPRVIKTYYKRMRSQVSVTWAYHILSHLRTILSWGVSEDWLEKNNALEVKLQAPGKRSIIWEPDQAEIYIETAMKMGWKSVAVMAHVFDSIAQSPIDVRTLRRGSYNGTHISSQRAKTGMTGAPIRLFPEAKAALDTYLEENPKLPDVPLLTDERTGLEWTENQLQRAHRAIRTAAGLPAYLQLQDFRTTALTEGGAAGMTVDEGRALGRHSTRSVGEHYVMPDARYVEAVQDKRLVLRNKQRQKVRIQD